jgi:hypothetical protein
VDARVADAVREPVERLREDEAGLDRAVADARRLAAARVDEARREAEALVVEARRQAGLGAERLRDEVRAALDVLEATARTERAREVAEIARRAAAHRARALELAVRRAMGEEP